jgi:hypothetical protein
MVTKTNVLSLLIIAGAVISGGAHLYSAEPNFEQFVKKLDSEAGHIEQRYQSLIGGSEAEQFKHIRYFKAHDAMELIAYAFPELKGRPQMLAVGILRDHKGSSPVIASALLGFLKSMRDQYAADRAAGLKLSDEIRSGLVLQIEVTIPVLSRMTGVASEEPATDYRNNLTAVDTFIRLVEQKLH